MNFNTILSALNMTEIASWYGGLKTVYAVIGAVLSAMLIYKTAYKIIGEFSLQENSPPQSKSTNMPL